MVAGTGSWARFHPSSDPLAITRHRLEGLSSHDQLGRLDHRRSD
jgi:hypothetical protein